MRTVLAFEPDARQAAALKLVVSGRVGADFVLAASKDAALSAIRSVVPDLILLTALISPRDESEIADLIRETDGAEHTQTLTIPLLDLGTSTPAKKKKRGLLSALTGETEAPGAPTGCDPAVFADEVANYLQQAEAARAEAAAMRDRRARKPRRKKRDAIEELQPEPAPAGSSNYWAWDTPHEVPAAESVAPTHAAPDDTHVAQAPVAEPAGEPTATGSSSWANPWDVSAPSHAYRDNHIVPGPDPFIAAGPETLDALFEQPAAASAADQLAATPIHHADFIGAEPDPVVEVVATPEPSDALRAFEQPVSLPVVDHASEPEPRVQVESEIVRAKLPTRAESGALLALQADVARLREQRASTDATLVAAKAAQERAAKAAAEAAAHAKREADRRADEAAARAREEARAERRARELAEKRAQEEAERRAEAEQRARQEAERLARQAADRAREEAAEIARQQAAAERKAREQAERQAREETERRVEAERTARERAERQAAAERKAREEAERRAREETARLEREARERQAHAEAERKAREAAEAHAAAERKAREQAEQRAREQAERLARDVERKAREAERKAQEEADRHATKAEQAAREQAEALARQAEARAREEAAAERRAREQAEQRAETERKAREQSERRAEAERRAREQAERAAEAARAEARQPAVKKAKPVRRAQKATAPKRAKKNDEPRAIQDEWGLYDPQAAGFEALFAKLESIENGETEIDEAPAPAARGPRPLAMWAFQFEPVTDAPAPISRKGRDDFRALVSQFSIPHAVAAVSYASGARIRKVKIPAVSTRRARADADPRVVILSRKLLKAARREAAADRLTARR